jgi:hypothetical protein
MTALSIPSATPHSIVETVHLGPNVLLTTANGHITRVMLEEAYQQFRVRLTLSHHPLWILDQRSITELAPDTVNALAEWFALFTSRGGRRLVLLGGTPSARMLIATLAFSARVIIADCDTLSEAQALLSGGAPSPATATGARDGERSPADSVGETPVTSGVRRRR